MIGHNGGPGVEPGVGPGVGPGGSWRRHCWQAARARLLPVLPIEVVRLRVRRAAELGLDYKTYAGVRAATGHDVVAFLFSSNALRVRTGLPAMPPDRLGKLQSLEACARIGLAVVPLSPRVLAQANRGALDQAHAAPYALAPFREVAAGLRAACGRVPGDHVLLVGDMALEGAWCAAGRLAGYLPAERYFGGV